MRLKTNKELKQISIKDEKEEVLQTRILQQVRYGLEHAFRNPINSFILYIEGFSIMSFGHYNIKCQSANWSQGRQESYILFLNITLQNLKSESSLLAYNNQIVRMQECLQRFAKRRSPQKWTSKEKEELKQTVVELEPQDNEGWKQVCLKMHSLGSRRTQQDYKNKGIIFLKNSDQQQIKLSHQDLDQITTQFENGMPVKSLVKKYAHMFISPDRLRSRLTQRFQSIRCSIRRIVGVSKTRPIKIQDCQLFAYIKTNRLDLLSLVQVTKLSKRHKMIKKPKNQEQRREIQQIEQSLSKFNQSLRIYSQLFDQLKKNQPQNISQQKGKSQIGRSTTVPFRHLSEIAREFNETNCLQMTSESECPFLNEGKYQKLKHDSISTMMTSHSFREEVEWQIGGNLFNNFQCSIDQDCDLELSYNSQKQDSFFRLPTAV